MKNYKYLCKAASLLTLFTMALVSIPSFAIDQKICTMPAGWLINDQGASKFCGKVEARPIVRISCVKSSCNISFSLKARTTGPTIFSQAKILRTDGSALCGLTYLGSSFSTIGCGNLGAPTLNMTSISL